MRCLIPVVCALAIGCGSDSGGGSPTSPSPAPTPTASAVTVALTVNPMFLGLAQQASATTTPPGMAGTWASADARIASVDSTGNVRGLASGSTDITYSVGGTVGRSSLRVVPEYGGSWLGDYSITGCTDSVEFRAIDFCKTYTRLGEDATMRASWTQTGAEVVGRINLSPGWPDTDLNTGRIEENGRMQFGGVFFLSGFRIRADWDLNSTQRGVITPGGSMVEEWTYPGVRGSARITAAMRVLRKQ